MQTPQNQNKQHQERKTLEKIQLEEIKPSNRKYPYVDFKPDREPGKEILQVKNISKTVDGVKLLNNISFTVKQDNKIAFLADNELAKNNIIPNNCRRTRTRRRKNRMGNNNNNKLFPKR